MYADPVLFQNKSVAVRLMCSSFLPGIYFIFRHVSNGKTRGNKMSNSTSQNRQGKIKKKGSFTRNLPLYLLMIPGLLYLIINNYLPMFGLTFAFKKINYTVGVFESPWVGLDNFTYLFKTSDAFVIFRNTLCYNLAFIVLGTVLAIVVAIFLEQVRTKMLRVYQTSILIPYLLSITVVLKLLGMDEISWYSSPKYWPFILTFIYLWKSFGYSSILYFATLIGIDDSYYEAAVIDGASTWQQIRHITLPCLKTTIITLVIMHIGRMFYSDFGLFYQVPMNNGLLFSVTNTIDTYVYRGLLQLNDVGRSSAAGFLQSILGFVLVMITNMITRKIDKESALF